MFCRNCGKEVLPQAVACVHCGVAPANGSNFCPNCGAATDAQAEFCIKCGVALRPVYAAAGALQDPTLKSKMAAGLLGIFLGWIGIHRFYLGYTSIGVAQCVLGSLGSILSPFTCGLLLIGACIWGLVEGIMILTGSINKDAQGRPLRD